MTRQSSLAQHQAPGTPEAERSSLLHGSWRLLSNEVEFRDDGAREPMFGGPSHGFVIFSPDGRMMVYVEADGRITPVDEHDQAQAYRTMCAYTGRFRLEGARWVTDVDGSWNITWSGTRQVRHFWLDPENRLHVASDWYSSPLHGGRLTRAHLTWEREA